MRAISLVALLGLMALVAPSARAHPHAAPTLWVNIEVREADKSHGPDVLLKITGRADWLPAWLGFTEVTGALRRGLPAPDALAEATARFARQTPAELNGVPAEPKGLLLKYRPAGLSDAGLEHFELHLVYGTGKAAARGFGLRWTHFDELYWEDKNAVPVVVEAEGDLTSQTLTPAEPSMAWHATKRTARFGEALEPVAAPPTVRWRIPLVSLFLLVGTLIFMVIAWRREMRPSYAGAGVVAGLVLTVVMHDTGVALVTSPFEEAIDMPSEAQGRTMLESLLRRVYDSFDQKGESAVYDVLAKSVHESLLDQMYGDIHESLILREDGGAVAQVRAVEFGELNVEVPHEGEADRDRHRFHVKGSWQVRCSITHFGHTHTRWNKYKARFAVQHDGKSWKIAEMNVIDYHREDDGKTGDRKGEQPAKD